MFIESGPATVIDAGVVTTWYGHSLSLVVQMPGDNVALELVFDESGGPPGVTAHPTDTGYRLECTGFDDATGRGTAEPMLLGELGDDLLYFHFRTFRYRDTVDRTVHYTVYRAHKSRVGWQASR